MAAAPARSSLSQLLKRGWNEIPEVIGSSVVGLLGLGILGFAVARYYAKDGDNRRFKQGIVIYRPDDPRVAKIRKD